MYKFLLWIFLIGVFIIVISVGLATAQERFVPTYKTDDGKLISVDLDSIRRGDNEAHKDFIAFKSRVENQDSGNYANLGIIANCKDKKYMVLYYEVVIDEEVTMLTPPPVREKSEKGSVIRRLIDDICTKTRPKKS
jgi:hypothetical protein